MTEFLDLVMERRAELGVKTLEHLWLAGSACLSAILVGVPLGMAITRHRRLAGIILGLAGVVQTVPSLALLALLQVWLSSMGFLPAYVALVLYALLPIIRNTFAGLAGVDAAILEAADGMGYTRGQRLWTIELPLAAPIILAGIRTATVITVGVATLSTLIGAGGLGDFINRGLTMDMPNLILLGVAAASLLALLLDGLLGWVERLLQKRLHQN